MGLLDELPGNPLFGIGMGLLASSGPSRNPVNPWAGAMQGLLSAGQYRKEQKALQRQDIMDQMAIQKYQTEVAQLGAQKQWAAQYDAQHPGGLATAFPDLVAKAWADNEALKSKETKAEITTAGTLGLPGVDPNLPVTVKRNAAGNITDYSLASSKVLGGAKGSGYTGTGMEQQAIETYVQSLPPEQQAGARLELTKQFLTQPKTAVTPDGTYVRPGMTLPSGAPAVAPQAAAPMAAQEPPPDAAVPAAQPAAPTGGLGVLMPKPATEGQSKAQGFHDVMASAGGIIDSLEAGGYDRTKPAALLPNAVADPTTQQYNQAASDWVRAKLRWESGAAIGKDEMEQEIKRYFPQLNEDAKVIAQKAQARKEAEIAMLKNTQGGGKGASPGKPVGKPSAKPDGSIFDKYPGLRRAP